MKIRITESQLSRIISEQDFKIPIDVSTIKKNSGGVYDEESFNRTNNPLTKIAIALVAVVAGLGLDEIVISRYNEFIKELEPTFNKLSDEERECVFNKLNNPPFSNLNNIRKFKSDRFLNLLFEGCVDNSEDIKNEIISISKDFKRKTKNRKVRQKI
jgi:hypothetical protein